MNHPIQSGHAIRFDDVTKTYQHRAAILIFSEESDVARSRARRCLATSQHRRGIRIARPQRQREDDDAEVDRRNASTRLRPGQRRGVQPDPCARSILVGFAVANERTFYPRLTARENLNFFAGLEGVSRSERPSRIDSTLRQIGLEEAADTLVMKFSTGMFQRLGIAVPS